MSVFLVRHGDARARDRWVGDDRLRPLTGKGRDQARGLVPLLAEWRIDRIVSSPAVRCEQTVEPLATERGLEVVRDPVLWEGSALAPVRRLLDDLEHAAICSHGDLIPDLLNHLIAEGMEAVGRDCKKGSTWVLDRDGAGFARATYLPPPPREG